MKFLSILLFVLISSCELMVVPPISSSASFQYALNGTKWTETHSYSHEVHSLSTSNPLPFIHTLTIVHEWTFSSDSIYAEIKTYDGQTICASPCPPTSTTYLTRAWRHHATNLHRIGLGLDTPNRFVWMDLKVVNDSLWIGDPGAQPKIRM